MGQLVVDRNRLAIVEIVVIELGGTNQARARAEFGETVEHQDPAAATIGAELEAGALGRERIRTHRQRLAGRIARAYHTVLIGGRAQPVGRYLDDVALVVIENDFEQPTLAAPDLAAANAARDCRRGSASDSDWRCGRGSARWRAQDRPCRRSRPRTDRRSRCPDRRSSR